jgi:methyl-accepting chemotaxis protein
VLARTALVLALVTGVVGWWQLGRLADNVELAVGVGGEAASSVAEALTIVSDLVGEVDLLVGNLDATLDQIDVGLGSVGSSADPVGRALAEELPDALDEIGATAARLASAGTTLQDIIERLPGDQNLTFGDELAALAESLEPLPATLRELAVPVTESLATVPELREELASAQDQLAEISASLPDLEARLDQLAEDTADTAAELTAAADRNDVRLLVWRLVLVMVVAVVVAFAVCLELLATSLPEPAPLR